MLLTGELPGQLVRGFPLLLGQCITISAFGNSEQTGMYLSVLESVAGDITEEVIIIEDKDYWD